MPERKEHAIYMCLKTTMATVNYRSIEGHAPVTDNTNPVLQHAKKEIGRQRNIIKVDYLKGMPVERYPTTIGFFTIKTHITCALPISQGCDSKYEKVLCNYLKNFSTNRALS